MLFINKDFNLAILQELVKPSNLLKDWGVQFTLPVALRTFRLLQMSFLMIFANFDIPNSSQPADIKPNLEECIYDFPISGQSHIKNCPTSKPVMILT